MRIVIAGGSGFLGSALAARLRASGHDVVTLTRRPRRAGDVAWDPSHVSGPWVEAIGRSDAVINLAGEPIEAGRWTDARKAAIRDSRIRATRAIVEAISSAETTPALLNASAIGIYGAHGDEIVTEATPPGSDFLASVCRDWEHEAEKAAPRARVVLLRTGLVLAKEGGVLPRLVTPFRLFAGGPAGSGRQYWSWIHLHDWIGIVQHMLASSVASGAVNLTAPRPVTNMEFATALGHALRRPSLLPTPAFALRIMLGEMADALILNGQRVVPVRAEASGYKFQYETVDRALRSLFT
ncbi:MAG: TIGR01777 family oxidoreductase [Vicinamibacterales bacterium]